MPYFPSFETDLDLIIDLINQNKINGPNEALDKFSQYLISIQSIGSFDTNVWRVEWRQKVWSFGELFKKVPAHGFITKLNLVLAQNTSNKEVLEFIKSEIAVNYMPDLECRRYIQELIGRYSLNPEFRHTLGQYYQIDKKFEEAIKEYKLILRIEQNNAAYNRNRFICESIYLKHLISIGEYRKGKEFLDALFSEGYYNNNSNYHNFFLDFNARLDDHMIFQEKIKNLEDEFKKRINVELESERKRIVEILGFFSAIVAFILSTVSLGENFEYTEAISFIIGLGIILLLFSVTLSILFTNKKDDFFSDKRTWVLIVGLIVLAIFIYKTTHIEN